MIISVHPVTPQKRVVDRIIEDLRKGAIFILPTDTVYAFVCLMDFPRSINEIYKVKGLPKNHHLSLLCKDIAMASTYARELPNHIFRFIKSNTPGPFTFILNANRNVDRRGTGKRKTVGIRIVDHPLHKAIFEYLDTPLISSSITSDDEFATDPEDLDKRFGSFVHAIIDGGIRYHEYSTILDCTQGGFRLIRQGIGDISSLSLME